MANGFYAQMTAQAVDFTILTIVLSTLLAATRLIRLPGLYPPWEKVLICSCIWVFPLITSATAVAKHALKPVGSNWCDLARTRTALRYALADGWRLAIMILTICSYAFIWWFLQRHRTLLPLSYERFTTRNKPRIASLASTSVNTRSSLPRMKRKSGFSSISLPFQGYDTSGVDFQERQDAIDSRTERISRWIHVSGFCEHDLHLGNFSPPGPSAPISQNSGVRPPRLSRNYSLTVKL